MPTTVLSTTRGKLILVLLCAIAFLDFIDGTIVNLALPSIEEDLHFSVTNLQWVASGYLLTYGGFMLLGGRASDLLGRRRILALGTVIFALSSLLGGFANSEAVLISARMSQGVGAAMMLPAALSILTTTFHDDSDRHRALGAWGATVGLASAAGALIGGALVAGPGWRWVLFINPIVCAGVLAAMYRLLPGDRPRQVRTGFDIPGALLSCSGLLLAVYALVKAPDWGWASGRAVLCLAAAGLLLVAFVVNERYSRNPLAPLSIFRVRGLAAADVTQLIAIAGFIAMFFFVTLYLQNVLGYSALKTGLAYLPLCFGVGLSAGVASKLFARTGTRPIIVVGSLVAGAGMWMLSRIPVDGSYLSDLLPGMLVMSAGLGAVFVGITTAANAGVEPGQAGLAAALLNTSQQLGGALGLAIFTSIATSRTAHLLAHGATPAAALTGGFGRALLIASCFVVGAAVIALRTVNTKSDQPVTAPTPESEAASESEAAPESRPELIET